MLERFIRRTENEKQPTNGTNIRFHHLTHWCDLVVFYHEKFPKDIWEYDGKDLEIIKYSIHRFLERGIESYIGIQHFLQKSNITDERMQALADLKNLNDVLGSTDISRNEVKKRWSESGTKLAMQIAKNKDMRIIINEQKDNLCNSCAVGKHCGTNIFKKFLFDRDSAYQEVLAGLVENNNSNWAGSGRLTLLADDNISLTGSLLFDKKFLSQVEETTLNRFPKNFKNREFRYDHT